MLFLAASVLVQIVCAVHVIRTGRNSLWVMVIVFFSLLGCFAYFVIEVLPGYAGNRHVRQARASVTAKLDPQRDLRQAQMQLELADTVANRISVADAAFALGRYGEAEPLYREALDRVHGDDWGTTMKLARTLFETGKPAEGLEWLETIPQATGISSEQDKRDLLRGRLLAELRRDAEARAIFEDVVTRIAGEEARCHYAAFLLDRGDKVRARQVLEEVERRAKRLDRAQRAAEADVYRWAADELAALRVGRG